MGRERERKRKLKLDFFCFIFKMVNGLYHQNVLFYQQEESTPGERRLPLCGTRPFLTHTDSCFSYLLLVHLIPKLKQQSFDETHDLWTRGSAEFREAIFLLHVLQVL